MTDIQFKTTSDTPPKLHIRLTGVEYAAFPLVTDIASGFPFSISNVEPAKGQYSVSLSRDEAAEFVYALFKDNILPDTVRQQTLLRLDNACRECLSKERVAG